LEIRNSTLNQLYNECEGFSQVERSGVFDANEHLDPDFILVDVAVAQVTPAASNRK
jgi:hypothetical protein